MRNEKSWLLTERQRPVVATAVTVFSLAVLIAVIYYGVVLLRDFVGMFSHVLLPLAIAAILATLLQPVVRFFDRKLRLGRIGSIILLFLLVIGALAGLGIWLVPILVEQIGQFIKIAPDLQKRMFAFLREEAPGLWMWLQQQLDFSQLRAMVEGTGSADGNGSAAVQEGAKHLWEAARVVGSYLISLFTIAAAYAVIPVYLCFILYNNRDSNQHDPWDGIGRELSFLSDQRRDDLLFLIRQFTEIIISFFRGQFLVGLILGAFLAVGFQVVGLQLGLIIGMVAGLINVIPYLGTILGLGIALPLAYFQIDGGWSLLAVVLGIFIAGQLLVDYVVLPRVMGERTGMSPMLIIFSVFFWGTALNGLLGMVLAIPLTAFFLIFWRLIRDKYIPLMQLGVPPPPPEEPAPAPAPSQPAAPSGPSAATPPPKQPRPAPSPESSAPSSEQPAPDERAD